ncbi:MAG: DUF3520 domain-containing protein [Candidatus Eisenbacteria bacterium]|nr:DUF3520 domain-containing protein [Candidatus Latescibacterota bacterium]MBD3302605.1 DUF3520 domain-containing protein [Candidatus Eisenbacteria bacterium]
MKERFESEREPLTERERRKVCGRIGDALDRPGRRSNRSWILALAGGAVALLAVGILLRADRPADRVEPIVPFEVEAGPREPATPTTDPSAPGVIAVESTAAAADPETTRAEPPPSPPPRRCGTIRGTVRDEQGDPVPYASVVVQGTPVGAMTDTTGSYEIRDLSPRSYDLTISVIGYGGETARNVSVGPGEEIERDFTLQRETVDVVDLVEITAARAVIQLDRVEKCSEMGSSLKGGVVAQGGRVHSRGGRSIPVFPTTGGSTLPNDEVYDSMFFEHYGVNPFIAAEEDSLSTFATDVDAGSYTVMRRYVEQGHLPPKEAVRVEEFVNYFDQGYPEEVDGDFRLWIEGALSPFGPGYFLLRIGIKARSIPDGERDPVDLILVIDTSGSMQRENRLELVKRALRLLLDRLGPEDRIGIVEYGSTGRVALDPIPADDRDRIESTLRRLQPEGSTNAEQGLRVGFEMARSHRRPGATSRILLCSDGVANVGRTGPGSILEEVRREADQGIRMTTIGFGMGNYNDVLMEQLADRGDGAYYYVDDLREAERVFVGQLTGTLQTIASDAKVQVAFDPRRVVRYRLLGFENRDVADRDFRNDRVDAGEIGAGHTVTALYEVKLAEGIEEGRIATVRLRFTEPLGEAGGPPRVREIAQSFDAGELKGRIEETSPRFRLDAAVAEFAEILRRSYWAKESRIVDVLPLARAAVAEMPGDSAAVEFVRLAETAADLSDTLAPEEREEIHGPQITEPGKR